MRRRRRRRNHPRHKREGSAADLKKRHGHARCWRKNAAFRLTMHA
jgi:hypothetical protein